MSVMNMNVRMAECRLAYAKQGSKIEIPALYIYKVEKMAQRTGGSRMATDRKKRMRVLIVNTSERIGGAALAANHLMDALNNNGVKATMLVRDKQTSDITVATLPHSWRNRLRFLWERWCVVCHLHFSRTHLFEVDIANTGADITRLSEFKEADIIHLSWINQGMLSLKGIRKILNSGKPVVWTMHDIWPATGICHITLNCQRFQSSCGDSHTSTHGAFGALAFGIGTSQVEHVLATQTLQMAPFRTMSVTIDGDLPAGSGAKDIILAIIAKIGTNGAQGHVIEYRGRAIERLSMEARMTICNMSIEGGARAGMIAPDQTTFDYLAGRPHAPVGEDWDAAVEYWKSLRTDDDAVFDTEVVLQAADIEPFVTWGTNPGQGLPLSARVPVPGDIADETERRAAERAIEYMDLTPGMPLRDIRVDTVFLGSCTNGRIEDLRAAAEVVRGRTKAPGVRMLVVPASARIRLQAEAEGLDRVFKDFGAEWRNAGCSMCLAMNPDKLSPGERSASTSNRNFEGRQGKGGRTHLVSPAVAAATAVRGTLSSPADLPALAAPPPDSGLPSVPAGLPTAPAAPAAV